MSTPAPPASAGLWVAGVGVVAPGLPTWEAARAVLGSDQAWTASEFALPAPAILNKNERRRASPTIRLALEASQQALATSGFAAADLALVFGSSTGDGDVLDAIIEAVTTAEGRVSPTMFHNSVHNAAAGYWSIATGARSASLSLAGFDGTVAATVFAAAAKARHGPVLCCAYDAALPATLRRLRDIAVPFAGALLLCPERPAAPVARLAVRIGTRGDASTPVRTPGLGALLGANPIARLLPLLEALARPHAATIAIDWDDQPPLLVDVTPA